MAIMPFLIDPCHELLCLLSEQLYASLYNSVSEALSVVEQNATHFVYSDQLRCVALILQLRFLSNPVASNLRLLGRLSSAVFRFPEAGRRGLVDIFRAQYPADVFGQRLVSHVKGFLNVTIRSQGAASATVW